MAGKSTERIEVEELIRLSAEARSELGSKIGKFRGTLRIPSKMMGSMRHHPKSWLFGSMLAGLGASLLLNQIPRRSSKKSTSLKKKAFALTLTAARPVAKMWLTKKLKTLGNDWIAKRVQPERAQPSPFQIEPNPNPEHVRTQGP